MDHLADVVGGGRQVGVSACRLMGERCGDVVDQARVRNQAGPRMQIVQEAGRMSAVDVLVAAGEVVGRSPLTPV